MNDPDYQHPRDRDPAPVLQELKEYAVSRVASLNNVKLIIEDLAGLEETTDDRAEQLKAMREVLKIESERVKYLKTAVRSFEEYCKIPEPVWPVLNESGKRRGGARHS